MAEIYWLQRLANIGFCFNVGFWVCVVVAIILICFIAFSSDNFDDSDLERMVRFAKKFAMVFGFFTLGAIMTPTSKDLMAIYGLGGTIDYIKSNDKAKELPDKVVDALTHYVDSIEKENDDDNDK